ncbi:MAG: hypothetical protein U1E17_16475 [Geminicoccaceae bacterium]
MAGAVGADACSGSSSWRPWWKAVETSRVARHVGAASGMSVAIGDAGGDYGAVIVSGANLLLDPAALAAPGLWAWRSGPDPAERAARGRQPRGRARHGRQARASASTRRRSAPCRRS